MEPGSNPFDRNLFAGTPHLQGQVVFKRNYRFPQLKKLHPRAHWVKSVCALDRNYYRKLGSILVRDDKVVTGQRNDLEAGMAYFKAPGATMKGFREEFPGLACKYANYFQQYYEDNLKPEIEQLDFANLYHWQEFLLYDVICKKPHSRRIYVILDTVGEAGKSTFANWVYSMFPDTCQILGTGKASDLAHAVKAETTLFLFDFTRASDIEPPWGFIEEVKNQRVWAPKYVSSTKIILKKPHCIVFTNTPVPAGKYSKDRLYVIDVSPVPDYPIFDVPSSSSSSSSRFVASSAPNFIPPAGSVVHQGNVGRVAPSPRSPAVRVPISIPRQSQVDRAMGRN